MSFIFFSWNKNIHHLFHAGFFSFHPLEDTLCEERRETYNLILSYIFKIVTKQKEKIGFKPTHKIIINFIIFIYFGLNAINIIIIIIKRRKKRFLLLLLFLIINIYFIISFSLSFLVTNLLEILLFD